MRDFSLAGISRLELEDDAFFIRPDDFDLDRYFAGRFSALAGDRVQTVRLRVVPERAEYFRRKQYHPTQAIEEIHADGSIVVAYSVLGLDEMRCFAQGWGVGVTVLEPEELVDIMRREAKELAERYGG
jgi:predicted DNA-binding transcriptional regulator YafY